MVRPLTLGLALARLAGMTAASHALSQSAATSPTPKPPDDDSYAPLRLYQGNWEARTTGDPKTSPTTLTCHPDRRAAAFAASSSARRQTAERLLPQAAAR
jgi:hypothetical protein